MQNKINKPIDLLGKTYNLYIDPRDEKTLDRAVEPLRVKIDLIRRKSANVDTDMMIVVAALNLIHDYLKISVSNDMDLGELDAEIRDMKRLCSEALDYAPASAKEG